MCDRSKRKPDNSDPIPQVDADISTLIGAAWLITREDDPDERLRMFRRLAETYGYLPPRDRDRPAGDNTRH